jgi:hypothetical protein
LSWEFITFLIYFIYYNNIIYLIYHDRDIFQLQMNTWRLSWFSPWQRALVIASLLRFAPLHPLVVWHIAAPPYFYSYSVQTD